MKFTKITILFLLFSCSLAISCSDDDDLNEELTCNPTEPFEEFEWLNELRESIDNCSCEISILKASYNDNTVFLKLMTDASCNSLFQTKLYNCDGEIIKEYGENELEEFNSEITEMENLYSCTVTR